MACFIVPAAGAAVTSLVQKRLAGSSPSGKIPFARKLSWLTRLLTGGSVLLAFEHIWHGEVTPWFPFLTAAATPESTSDMLHEMMTVGIPMTLLVVIVWAGMLVVAENIVHRQCLHATVK